MTTEVDNLLSQLRLAGMRESFSNRNKEAIKGKLSYQDFLKILAQDELLPVSYTHLTLPTILLV